MPKFDQREFELMIQVRALHFLERNMRVEVNGKTGRVVGNHGFNLLVRFDETGFEQNCHPTWMVKYFNTQGELIKEFKD